MVTFSLHRLPKLNSLPSRRKTVQRGLDHIRRTSQAGLVRQPEEARRMAAEALALHVAGALRIKTSRCG